MPNDDLFKEFEKQFDAVKAQLTVDELLVFGFEAMRDVTKEYINRLTEMGTQAHIDANGEDEEHAARTINTVLDMVTGTLGRDLKMIEEQIEFYEKPE